MEGNGTRLWAMTSEERLDAMWQDELSLAELVEWTQKAPHEVPLEGDEFAWIVARTPELDRVTPL